jgi:hypothetical protein
MKIPSGATNLWIHFRALDEADFKTPLTGLSSFSVRYNLDDNGDTAMTTPTVVEISASNQPGNFRLLIDEAGMTTLDSGKDSQELIVHISHAGMVPAVRTIEIYRPKITLGETLTVSSGALASIASSVWAALLDLSAGVETNLTLRQFFRLAASALFGKASGLNTTTAVFRDYNDTKDRLSATVDSAGNRTAVTRDAS